MAEAVLARLLEPVASELAQVRSELGRLLRPEAVELQPLLEHVSGFDGKRLRPAQVLLAGKALGGFQEVHIQVAGIVEMIHTATLIHDDVLDEAVLRRNLPALHTLHGVEAAVLLGDYVYAAAFGASTRLSDQTCSRILAETTRVICQGELTQVLNRGRFDLSREEYDGIIAAKTASLYGAACELGALYAGADARIARRFTVYGRALGQAFQIVDDCLDLAGLEAVAGKTLGSDVLKGKMTLPLIYVYGRADEAGQREMARIFRDVAPADRRGALEDAFDLDWGLTQAREQAHRLAEEALAALEGLGRGPAAASLRGLAGFVLQRER